MQDLVARNALARAVVRQATRAGRIGVYPIASGPAKGMLIDVAGSRPTYVLGKAEPEIQSFLAEHIRPGDVVLDVGANVGFFTLMAAALTGPSGHVVAFEPSPKNATALRANLAANRLTTVQVVEAAVAAEEGQCTLHMNESNQEASLVNALGHESITVQTVTVDSEMRRLGLAPNVIKIDVEGAEDDVIRGMRSTLEEARPTIVCEMHVGIPQLDDPVPATLKAAGYQVAWLEPEVVDGIEFWAPHLVALPDPARQ